MKLPATDVEFLESRGWQQVPSRHSWNWRQPKTKALLRLQDALDNQHAIDNDKTIGRKAKKDRA